MRASIRQEAAFTKTACDVRHLRDAMAHLWCTRHSNGYSYCVIEIETENKEYEDIGRRRPQGWNLDLAESTHMSDKVKCNICSKLYADREALEHHKRKDHPIRRDTSDLVAKAEDRLYEYLSSDGTDRNLREVAKTAAVVYNAESRKEASKNNALTAALMMARSVTSDKNEIRRIVAKALPHHPIADALGEAGNA